MFTNNRSETIAPVKGDDKVRDINKELAELGTIKANLEKEIAEYKALAADYYGLDEKVAEKDIELQKLNIAIKDANIKVEEVERLKQNVLENREIIEILQKEITDLLHTKDELNTSVTSLDKDKSTKEAELNSAILALEDKLSKLKNEYITFERGAIKKVDEYDASLSDKSEKLNKLLADIVDAEKDLNSLNTKRAKLSLEIESLNISITEAINKLNQETIKADSKYDERMAEFEEYKAGKILELEKRDGEISDKARFLDVRENFLKDIKSQLEDKLGKKIDNLVF